MVQYYGIPLFKQKSLNRLAKLNSIRYLKQFKKQKFLRNFLSELGFEQNIINCYEDNTGCIDWITKPRASTRMKAIELKYYSIREDDEDEGGAFRFIHIPTKDQRADLLTKQMDNSFFSPLLPNVLKY